MDIIYLPLFSCVGAHVCVGKTRGVRIYCLSVNFPGPGFTHAYHGVLSPSSITVSLLCVAAS